MLIGDWKSVQVQYEKLLLVVFELGAAQMKIILAGLILYVLFGLFLYFSQRSLLFPGKELKAPVSPQGMNIQQIWFETKSGRVEGWFFPVKKLADSVSAPAVIYAHGNYELIDYNINLAAEYNRLGVHVLMVEFPGYGRAEGQPGQTTLREVFCAGYDWLSQNAIVDADRIFAHGRSVGGGVVCDLALHRKLNALILQSTFSSVRKYAAKFLMPGFLVKDPFDNLAAVSLFKKPILILHGKYDEIIPYSNSEQLNRAAANAVLIGYECGHNDFPPDWDRYWAEIKKFLQGNKIIE